MDEREPAKRRKVRIERPGPSVVIISGTDASRVRREALEKKEE